MVREFRMDCKGKVVTPAVQAAVNKGVGGDKALPDETVGKACVVRDENVGGKPHYTIYTGEDASSKYFIMINGNGYLKGHEECKVDEKGNAIDMYCDDKTFQEFEINAKMLPSILGLLDGITKPVKKGGKKG